MGEDYRFLLISGANTGGKTVTLKMCGLFCLMAASGLFVPAAEGTTLPVFDQVFCDVGDAQSIEENLSTFSSHIGNIVSIVREADESSLVLIDELGGGTDPEEGQAIAKAVISYLLRRGCRGIVTTHYTALKEFAYAEEGIENASMEFDSESLKPLFRLKIGMPGASNALFICSKLGLPEEVILEARSHLSLGAQAFDHTVRAARRAVSRRTPRAKRRRPSAESGRKSSLRSKGRGGVQKGAGKVPAHLPRRGAQGHSEPHGGSGRARLRDRGDLQKGTAFGSRPHPRAHPPQQDGERPPRRGRGKSAARARRSQDAQSGG